MKKFFSLFTLLVVTICTLAQPAWPTYEQVVNEATTGVPQDLIDLSRDYIITTTHSPADTTYKMVPKISKKHKLINFKWVLLSVDTTWVSQPKITPAKTTTTVGYGKSFIKTLIDIANAADPEQLVYVGREGNIWKWHKYGVRFTDTQGDRQDIAPYDVTIELTADNKFIIKKTGSGHILTATKGDPTKCVTSITAHVVVEDGIAYNRTLINGKPWQSVDMRTLITSWGKTNTSYVWRWWGWGDFASGNIVRGDVTFISQHDKNDPKGQTLNIAKGSSGSYNQSTHTFTYPQSDDEPIYIMLQLEYLPANYKQAEARQYYMLYPWRWMDTGQSFIWPLFEGDPNRELY